MIHLGHEAGKHLFCLLALAVQVFHDAPLAFRQHDVNGYGSLLAKPPATADGLVVLLKGMGRKVGDVVAVLEVEPPCADLGLGDQDTGATFGEVDQPLFLEVVAVGT